jgi:ribonuclease HI
VPGGRFESGAESQSTNQRMEITAALRALQALGPESGDDGILVISDSTYVVNCFRQRWWAGWRARGWINSQRKPVANRDLWEPLFAVAVDGGLSVSWQWVKGHSGDRWNDVVDRLAQAAAASGTGQQGTA